MSFFYIFLEQVLEPERALDSCRFCIVMLVADESLYGGKSAAE